MEHKKKILTDFNTVLDEFIEKMILQFPEESKLKSYKSAYNVTKMYDKSMPIKVAMGGMLPFKTQIKDRDEDFFKSRETFLEKAVVASSFSNDLGLVNRESPKYQIELEIKNRNNSTELLYSQINNILISILSLINS